VLFLGAGSAALDIGSLLASAIHTGRLSKAEAHSRISMFDINGLLEPSRTNMNNWQSRSPTQR
jgi:malate dehydrogenase (oxaloacetate-decarboxylating)(NADP+)